MPDYLVMPLECRNNWNQDSYKLVNGPGTAFEIGKNIGATDLKDGNLQYDQPWLKIMPIQSIGWSQVTLLPRKPLKR